MKKKQIDLEKSKLQCECGRELKEHNNFFLRCPYCAKLVQKEGVEIVW